MKSLPLRGRWPRRGRKGSLVRQMDSNVVCCAGARTNVMLWGVRAPAMRYAVRIGRPYKRPSPGAALRSAPVLSLRERLLGFVSFNDIASREGGEFTSILSY